MALRTATKDENVPRPRTSIIVAAGNRGRATLAHFQPAHEYGRMLLMHNEWAFGEQKILKAASGVYEQPSKLSFRFNCKDARGVKRQKQSASLCQRPKRDCFTPGEPFAGRLARN